MASEELATVHELLRGVDLDDLTIAERRAAIESVAAPPPPGTTVEPVDAGGVPAEWVIAAGVDSVRVLLYMHGGAYQIGSPATLRRMIALISAAAQVRVLSAGYRLAPEHPFPAAVDDVLTAYRFLLHGGADPAAIAIAGDSAGGAWPSPRWWRCATLAIRCPRRRSRCRPGRTWRSPVSRCLPARTSM